MPTRAPMIRHLFGVPIHALRMEETLSRVADAIETRSRLLLGVVNVAKVVNMKRNPELQEAVLSADMILADGAGIVLASRLLGRALPERVAGIDLMERILDMGNERRWRVFCFGATEDVLGTTVARISEAHPKLVIAGQRNGYYDPGEEAQIVQTIREARPDVLFVAMTSPKKEQFLARWSEFMGVPVCHGVGGAFDVMAGKVRRAPAAWQKLGLEWLFRVKEEPGRMWKRYLVTNTLFAGMVLSEMARRIRPSSRVPREQCR